MSDVKMSMHTATNSVAPSIKDAAASVESEKSESESRMNPALERNASIAIHQTPPSEVHKLQSETPASPLLRQLSGPGSPRVTKQFILPRQNSHGGPDTLVPPVEPLLAPLDATRPAEPAGTIPPIAHSSPRHSPRQAAAASASAPHSPVSLADSAHQPNANEDWSTLRSRLHGKQLVIFLDYDGTLTPIVSDPLAAIIDDEQRKRVAALAKKHPVSIVTGRKLDTITKFIQREPLHSGLDQLYFAGSHGFDIRCPPGQHGASCDKVVAEEFLPYLAAFRDSMAKAISEGSIQGAMVEDNRFSISVHYRNVPEGQRDQLASLLHSLLTPYEEKGQLRLTHGHKVYEVRANLDWHKGAAVNYLMQLMCANSSASEHDIVPIYIGDDITDEDAFKTLRLYRHSATHPSAVAIFVRDDAKARPSAASHVLRSPQEVGQFLEKLATL